MNSIGRIVAFAVLALGSAAQAQEPGAEKPAVATLPGDGPLPTLEFMLNPGPGRPGGARPPATPPAPVRAPSMALAGEAAQAVVDTCRAQGFTMSVAVTDAAGNLRYAIAPDGARPGNLFVALRKTQGAIEFRVPTSQIKAMIEADPSVVKRIRPGMAVYAGAVPLMLGDELVGAIGASGAKAEQDEACALAGAEKIRSRLK